MWLICFLSTGTDEKNLVYWLNLVEKYKKN